MIGNQYVALKPLLYERPLGRFHSGAAIALGVLLSFSPLLQAETVTISRRLVRFDGKPAAAAKVRYWVITATLTNRRFEVTADVDGIFLGGCYAGAKPVGGGTHVRAEGCAILCEVWCDRQAQE